MCMFAMVRHNVSACLSCGVPELRLPFFNMFFQCVFHDSFTHVHIFSSAPSFGSLVAHRALLGITGEGADLLLEAGGLVGSAAASVRHPAEP